MKRQNKIIFILILLLGIGFATVTTTLYLNGSTTVTKNENAFKEGIIFAEESIRKSDGTTAVLSESGRTITWTTPTFKSIGDEDTIYFKIKNISQYDATLGTPAIVCKFVSSYADDLLSESEVTSNPYLSVVPATNLNGVTINAGGNLSDESHVTAKQIKSYKGNDDSNEQTIKFQCSIAASASESTESNQFTPSEGGSVADLWIDKGQYKLLKAEGNTSNEAETSDEIAIGDEHFYVISNDGESLKALAKYNLNVGSNAVSGTTGIQNSAATGWVSGGSSPFPGAVAFSDNYGWPYANNDDINIKDYAGPVQTALYDEDTGYESYIQQTAPNATVRLITKSEIEALVNDGATLYSGSIKAKADAKGYQWLYSTSFWSGSAISYDDSSVWDVNSSGDFSDNTFRNDSFFGVRPVIILES